MYVSRVSKKGRMDFSGKFAEKQAKIHYQIIQKLWQEIP
jgi:hypothetical protein